MRITPLEVLEKAKEILQNRNLQKGRYASLNEKELGIDPFWDGEERKNAVAMADSVCLGAAIYGAGGFPRETRKACEMLAKTIGLGEEICNISTWNDRPETTKEMALEVLETTIRNNNNDANNSIETS